MIMDPKIGKSLFNTQEIKSTNSDIQYYQNSISSFSYLLSSYYLILFTNCNLINSYIIFLLFSMSIVSYLWWAKQKKIIHIFDIFLYSCLILTIGLYTKVISNEYQQQQFFIYSGLFIFSLIILINFNFINLIKFINILSGIFSFIILYKNNYLYVLSIFSISVLFKFIDSSGLFKLTFISGTAMFHILSALGYAFLIK